MAKRIRKPDKGSAKEKRQSLLAQHTSAGAAAGDALVRPAGLDPDEVLERRGPGIVDPRYDSEQLKNELEHAALDQPLADEDFSRGLLRRCGMGHGAAPAR